MKSHVLNVQGQLDILQCIYLDACAECSVNPSRFDIKTFKARVEDEGLSFLTITLPSFARDFERSLDNGKVSSTDFRGFEKARNHGRPEAIPALMQGMLSIIFDRTTGVLYDLTSENRLSIIDCVRAVRQICRSFSKLQSQCLPKRERRAIAGFVHIEQTLHSSKVHENDILDFYRVCRSLWDPIFISYDETRLIPKHGPGTSSEGITGNRKYIWKSWHDRIERYFPFLGFALPLGASLEMEFNSVSFLSEVQEIPSKVFLVPKTMKTPRIIAAEPLAAQFAQQAVRSYLYGRIESSDMTRGRINFRDQSVNQRLAMISSKDRTMATLDLSDASDRVLHDLAMCMFHGSPVLAGAVQACRTSFARLPDGSVLGPLKKFASMGSALCFPVEAMYFYTICVVALLRSRDLPFDLRSIRKVGKEIFVYGDDLIVPVAEADAVCVNLQKYLCKVNLRKSFWTGRFRESCGLDAYDGEVVTPTYVRHFVPTNRRQHTEIISLVAAANSFYMKGYWQTARFLFERIERLVGPLPLVFPDSSAVGRISFLRHKTFHRWNVELFTHQVRALVAEPVYRTDRLEGYAALGKSLSSLASQVHLDMQRDPLHLERSARHGVAALKRRWVSVP